MAVRDADVTVTGSTPNGPWKETAKTGKQGDFEVPLPFAATGPIEVSVAKGDLQAEASLRQPRHFHPTDAQVRGDQERSAFALRNVGIRRRSAEGFSRQSKRLEMESDQGARPLGDGRFYGRVGPGGLSQDVSRAGRLARQANQAPRRSHLQPCASLGQRPAGRRPRRRLHALRAGHHRHGQARRGERNPRAGRCPHAWPATWTTPVSSPISSWRASGSRSRSSPPRRRTFRI